VQIPVNVPVNVCGDTVNVVGLLNPAVGNDCANGAPGTPTTPPPTTPSTPCPPPTSPTSPLPPPPPPTSPTTPTTPPTGPTTTPTTGTTGQVGGQTPGGTLAHTGAEGLILGPIGAALVGGGTVLYRRTRKTGSH
jgi:LPXTG-motif cell wall-anchored protein